MRPTEQLLARIFCFASPSVKKSTLGTVQTVGRDGLASSEPPQPDASNSPTAVPNDPAISLTACRFSRGALRDSSPQESAIAGSASGLARSDATATPSMHTL